VLFVTLLINYYYLEKHIIHDHRISNSIPTENKVIERVDVDPIQNQEHYNNKYTSEITTSSTSHSYNRILAQNSTTPPECQSEDDNGWVTQIPKEVQYIIIIVLIIFSAFFSGLTLALMGLDVTGLEIVMSGDDPDLARAASKILPIRKDGNLLLCTLLLGNVAVNTLLGILMADITGGTVGFFTSTIMIVIFGEILPQAAFSRYALQVGEKLIPMVKVIIFLLYIVAKPLAFCLDKVLGHELGTTYSKAELSKLLEIHVKEGKFSQEVGTAMTGALKYQDMTVKEIMTPLENTFMINVEERLNFATMATIFKTGYSRIPVYESDESNVIGLLFVKDLIFIDPEDETPIRTFIQIFGRAAHVVWPDDSLGDVLRHLKKGSSHMALVRDVCNDDPALDPVYVLKGIITLEDIIEVILGADILDENDYNEDDFNGENRSKFNWANLRLLDSKIVDQNLSEDEVKAISAHLRVNFPTPFSALTDHQLMRLLAATPVTELPESVKAIGEFLPRDLLYEKDICTDKCVLILSGKVTVLVGNDNFKSDISSWSLLGGHALLSESFKPDFNAYVSGGPCRCLCITRDIFTAAQHASKLERIPDSRSSAHSIISPDLQPQEVIVPSSLNERGLGSKHPSDSDVVTSPEERTEHRSKLLEVFMRSKSELFEKPVSEILEDCSDIVVGDEALGDDVSLESSKSHKDEKGVP
jgi:metal transporter CNNM